MMMMNDKEFVLDQLNYVEMNLPVLAKRAVPHFIDPNVRPKDKRVAWTEKSYTEGINAGITYYRTESNEASWAWKRKVLFGLKEFVLACLDDQFLRFRDVWGLLHIRWQDPAIDMQKRARQKGITLEQLTMETFDRARKCPGCARPVFIRDLQNNYIDLKKRAEREVCGAKDPDPCPYARDSRRLRELITPEITRVRNEREEDKRAEDARREKKRRLHGTEYPDKEEKK